MLSRFSNLRCQPLAGYTENRLDSRAGENTLSERRVGDNGHAKLPCSCDEIILLVVDEPRRILDLQGIDMCVYSVNSRQALEPDRERDLQEQAFLSVSALHSLNPMYLVFPSFFS
jgi:hypothetical protein